MTTQLRIAVRAFGPFEQSIQEQFSHFIQAEKLDATLTLEIMELPALETALFDQQGLRNGRFDLAFLNTDWLANAVHGNALHDLAPLMKTFPIPDYPAGWSKSLTGMPHIKDAVYGLPYHDGPQCLIYRTDLIDKPPVTWDEFWQLAVKTSDPSIGRYGTILAAFPDGHNTVYDFCVHLWTRGGEILDARDEPNLNCPQAVAGLTFYRSLIRSPFTHPDAQTIDSVKSGMLFSEGKVSMMTNWFGFAAMCQTLDTSRVKNRVGIAPIPSDPGSPSCSLNVYWFLSVASGSANKELAYRFIRHCLRADMDKLLTLRGATGCRLSTWADPEVNRAIPFFKDLSHLHQTARSFPVDRRFHQLTHIIEAAVLRAIRTEDSTQTILDQAQTGAIRAWRSEASRPSAAAHS